MDLVHVGEFVLAYLLKKQRKGGLVLHEREPRLGEGQRRELGNKYVCASTIEWFTHECFSRVSTDTQPSFPLGTPF